jgi:hypothetical protein
VTKNFSVTGSILNITYVDDDLYDIPELPIEMIYLNRESYEKFYESIYRFNRDPYKLMASRLRDVTSIVTTKMGKTAIVEFLMSRYSKLAIPTEHVLRDTPVFEISSESPVDCHALMRNSLARYIEYMRVLKILTCTPIDIDGSGEYPYLSTFDHTPYTKKVERVSLLDGSIPQGIYQFTTNPWLPIYEYYKSYDRVPVSLLRLVPDKKHLPIWFMTKQFRNSHEIAVSYQLIEDGESYVDFALEELRAIEDSKEIQESNVFGSEGLCWAHAQGRSPWEEADDIFNIQLESCVLCIMEDTLWRSKRLSVSAQNERKRLEYVREVPIIRSRIKYVVKHYYSWLEPELPRMLQESGGTSFFNAAVDDTGESLFDMFDPG